MSSEDKISENSESPVVIAPTQRADGTWRKEIKVKPGFIADGIQTKKYVVPMKRDTDSKYNVDVDLSEPTSPIKQGYENTEIKSPSSPIIGISSSLLSFLDAKLKEKEKVTTKLSSNSPVFVPKQKHSETPTPTLPTPKTTEINATANNNDIDDLSNKMTQNLHFNKKSTVINNSYNYNSGRYNSNSYETNKSNNNNNNSNNSSEGHYNKKPNYNQHSNTNQNQNYKPNKFNNSNNNYNNNNNNNNNKKYENNTNKTKTFDTSKIDKDIEKINSQLKQAEEAELLKSQGKEINDLQLMYLNSKQILLENLESLKQKKESQS